jgi:hypothetical protein
MSTNYKIRNLIDFANIMLNGAAAAGFFRGDTALLIEDIKVMLVCSSLYMEIKLVSVHEMNYHAKHLKGKVWVRGPAGCLG